LFFQIGKSGDKTIWIATIGIINKKGAFSPTSMTKLTQFEVKLDKKDVIKGEYEGDADSGRAIIFSHGFGVKRDSWGMFTKLGDLLKSNFLL